MGVINTVKSVMNQVRPEAKADDPLKPIPGMPPEPPPFEPGPDEVEEDEPDREGNTDPGTNQPGEPAPEGDDETAELFPDDPAVIRKTALAKAAAEVKAKALADAEAALPAATPPVDPIVATKIVYFDMKKVGETMVHFHLTAIGSNGQQYVVTGDLPVSQNTVADAIVLLQKLAR